MDERYQILSKLATGGSGSIYRAHDRVLHREVAIKRLNDAGIAKGESAALLREARTLSQLQHPNIVQIFDTGEDDEGVFIVMELLDGQDLDQVVGHGEKRKPLDLPDFQTFTRQCLDALIAASQFSVLHRDIKPANVILKRLPSGGLLTKMLDFG